MIKIIRLINIIENKLRKTIVYKIVHPYLEKRCKERHIKRNQYFKLEAKDLLYNFSETLNQMNIKFWLDFGTLLGYYRENDFIKNDLDLDVGAFLEDAKLIRELLTKKGFQLVREFKTFNGDGLEETYLFKHTSIDIFYYRQYNNVYYCNSYKPLINKITRFHIGHKIPLLVKDIFIPYKGLKKVKYKMSYVFVPVNEKEYLQAHYGPTFMIPNPNFNAKKEATNINYYTYDQKQGEGVFFKKY